MNDNPKVRANHVATMRVKDNGVLLQTYNPDIVLDAKDAADLLKLAKEIMPEDEQWLILLDQRSKFKLTREGRNYFSDHMPKKSVMAFVISSKAAEVAGNFFIRLNKPEFPVRMFNDMDAAEAWLLSHKK